MNPARAGAASGATPGDGQAAVKPLALILDDSPFLALHLARQLDAHGLEARVAPDAAGLCAEAPAANLVFIELELFDASGFEITRTLAAGCSCPVVLLSGTGRSTDRQWGLRAGASAVLPRPVTDAALRATLAALCGAERS